MLTDLDTDRPGAGPIESIYLVLATFADGSERIVRLARPDGPTPLITTNIAGLPDMWKLGLAMSAETGYGTRLVRFERRDVIESA
jgi:hypothetical protein